MKLASFATKKRSVSSSASDVEIDFTEKLQMFTRGDCLNPSRRLSLRSDASSRTRTATS